MEMSERTCCAIDSTDTAELTDRVDGTEGEKFLRLSEFGSSISFAGSE